MSGFKVSLAGINNEHDPAGIDLLKVEPGARDETA
jgi:hypothetical protein